MLSMAMSRRKTQKLKTMQRWQEKKEREERPWSDLPPELLELIIKFLGFADRIRVLAVCKTWQSAAHWIITQHPDHRPWLLLDVFYDDCHLLDAWSMKLYTINIPNFSDNILSSAHGWLLLRDNDLKSMFFLHPFTKARINLPVLEDWRCYYQVAFSSAPTSPDCNVFVLRKCCTRFARISTCRFGDSKWMTQEYETNISFNRCSCDPIFYNGYFYCLGQRGKLGAFNVSAFTWTVLEPTGLHFPWDQANYLVCYDGELFVVEFGMKIRISKLYYSLMTWKEEKNFGDTMVLNHGRKMALAVSKGKKRKISIPKKIYHRYTGFPVFKQSVKQKEIRITRFHHCVWIEPTWFQPLHQELKWSG